MCGWFASQVRVEEDEKEKDRGRKGGRRGEMRREWI